MASVLLDLDAFAAPGFSPAAWINAATAGRPGDEPLDRFLSELEMRLQLLAEDVGAALEDAAAASLARVPRALAEIDRLRVRGRVPRGGTHLTTGAGVSPIAAREGRVQNKGGGEVTSSRRGGSVSPYIVAAPP